MRIFFFSIPGFRRYIDMDHIQEISDLHFRSWESELKEDKDGIAYWSDNYGRASFWIQKAFQTERDHFELDYKMGTHLPEGKTRKEMSDEMMVGLKNFKAEYERLLTEWRSKDGSEPEFTRVPS